MHKLITVAAISLFASSLAFAQAGGDCESKAMSKDGKPLAGAAKAAFMKKCERETKAAAPASGKTAQQQKMKDCNAQAKGKKGQERKDFMKSCLSS